MRRAIQFHWRTDAGTPVLCSFPAHDPAFRFPSNAGAENSSSNGTGTSISPSSFLICPCFLLKNTFSHARRYKNVEKTALLADIFTPPPFLITASNESGRLRLQGPREVSRRQRDWVDAPLQCRNRFVCSSYLTVTALWQKHFAAPGRAYFPAKWKRLINYRHRSPAPASVPFYALSYALFAGEIKCHYYPRWVCGRWR